MTIKIEFVREDLAARARSALKSIAREDEDARRRRIDAGDPGLSSDPCDEYWVLVTRYQSAAVARCTAELISDIPFELRLRGVRPWSTVGSSPEQAVKRMHWAYVMRLLRARYGTIDECRKRARMATFRVADVRDV